MRAPWSGRVRAFGVAIVLLVLLAAAWPGGVTGQGLQPQSQHAVQFLKRRVYDPDSVPPKPLGSVIGRNIPEGLPVWGTEVVDETANLNGYVDLALDFAGRPHLSYLDYDIRSVKYASRQDSGWQSQVVDFGEYNSLAVDSAGRPHLSYYNGHTGGLNYASYDGVAWQIHEVDPSSGGDVGWFNSLALDAAGRPHISYHSTGAAGTALKYVYYDGSAWHPETIDSGEYGDYVGRHTSLALDSAGNPRVSYSAGGALRYASWDGNAWRIETVASSGIESSLALDQSGNPHIAFASYVDANVQYAWYDGAAWHIQNITNPGEGGSWPSLALDSAGHPHVSYYSASPWGLEYASSDGVTWYHQTVEVGHEVTYYTSIALDVAGRPHIAYALDNQVKYAAFQTDLAAWSRLAFASYRDMNWEVYAAQGDGAAPVRLTHHNAVDSRPEFGRGATQIVFDSRRPGNYDIYRMNADGSVQTRLTATGFNEYLPTWSPDGSKIAYYGYPDTPTNGEVYVMNADGSGRTQLTWNGNWDGHPTWSTDSNRIAFVSDRTGAYELWTMNADGSNQQQLSHGLQYAAYPDWSPDGSRIALNDDYNLDGWFDLAVINADGTGLTHPLGASPYLYDYLAPTWSPNADYLAFAQIQYINYQGNWYWVDAYIWGLRLSSGSLLLLGDSGYDWWPDWEATDVLAPTSQVAALPAWSQSTFTVGWSGSDGGGAGLRSYDVQVRDGAGGTWTDWLVDTTLTAETYGGENGHTYYFRCRARDYAYNLEPYPDEADAWTTVDLTPPTSSASSPAFAAAPPLPSVGREATWAPASPPTTCRSAKAAGRGPTGCWRRRPPGLLLPASWGTLTTSRAGRGTRPATWRLTRAATATHRPRRRSLP